MTHLHDEIEDLNHRLRVMAEAVQKMITEAVKSVVERDSNLAREVIRRDKAVDELEIEVDETAVRLLACYQPMAVDLRVVVNYSKIAGTLERMGDFARKIANAALHLNSEPPLRDMSDVVQLAQLSQAMIQDAMESFFQSDARLARQVRARDDEVDQLRDRLFEWLKQKMKEDPDSVERSVSLLLITSALERLADKATSIGEDVVNVVEGVIIKHQHDQGKPPAS